MLDMEIIRFDAIESELSHAKDRSALFSDDAFCANLGQLLEDRASGATVISLDVFDTLLFRDDSSEITRFFEIGTLMSKIVRKSEVFRKTKPVDAFVARHLGVKASYRASDRVKGAREGSLTEIHRVASRLISGSDAFVDTFIEAELEYESGRLTLNTLLHDYMRKMKSRGYKVALLSDMYMHDDQIQRLLESAGVVEGDFDILLSSADTKVSKASGGIFHIAEERLGCKSSDFFHIGDSYVGDFKMPKKHGWNALHLPVSSGNIERRQADHINTWKKLSSEFGVCVDIKMPE